MPETEFETDQSDFSLRSIYFILFRRKKMILLCMATFLLATVIAYGVISTQTTYTSHCRLFVRIGRESLAVDPTVSLGGPGRAPAQRQERQMNNEIEILTSREIAQQVLDAIGVKTILQAFDIEPEKKGGPLKKLARALRRKLKKPQDGVQPPPGNPLKAAIAAVLSKTLQASPVRGTSMIEVSFSSKSPRLSRDVLQKFIDFYLDKRLDIHFTDSSYNFLNQQSAEVRARLEETEQKIKDLRSQSGDLLLGDQTIFMKIAKIREDLGKAETARAASQARLTMIQNKLAQLLPAADNQTAESLATVVPPPEVTKRLYELKLEEQELLSKFTAESVPVQEVQRQIGEIQRMFAIDNRTTENIASLGNIPSPELAQLRTQLLNEEVNRISLDVQIEQLGRQLAQEQNNIQSYNEDSFLLGRLMRQKELYESSYRRYSQSLEGARIDQSLKMEKVSNIMVAQAPTYPFKPDATKAGKIFLAGLMLSLAGSLGLAFVFESFDHTLKTPDDVNKHLNLRCLSSVPHSDATCLVPDTRHLNNLLTFPESPSHKPGSDSDAIPRSNQHSAAMESFEVMFHRLFSYRRDAADQQPFVIAVTSSRKQEGVSIIAKNLAAKMARYSQGRILLADLNLLMLGKSQTDIEKTSCADADIGNTVAVSNVKKTGSDSPFGTIDELYLLKYEKYGSEYDVRGICDLWKDEYDVVVMDIPPVLDNARAITLSRLANEVILVVEAERERREAVNIAKEMLLEAGCKLRGAILNKRRYYIPEWLYKKL